MDGINLLATPFSPVAMKLNKQKEAIPPLPRVSQIARLLDTVEEASLVAVPCFLREERTGGGGGPSLPAVTSSRLVRSPALSSRVGAGAPTSVIRESLEDR